MRKMRKYAFVLMFVAAAILTPPSWETQLALALPLILLYQLSIWLTKFFAKKREEKLDKDLSDDDEDSEDEEND